MRKGFIWVNDVSVFDILLDIENYRYDEERRTQAECIEIMLNDKESKIELLAKDIAENGLYPEHIIIWEDGKNWVVKEGNRRVLVLKLLNNPSLIRNDRTRSKFVDIARNAQVTIPDKIDCITHSTLEVIENYVYRLHAGIEKGVGRLNWNPRQKRNYSEHAGHPSYLDVTKSLEVYAGEHGIHMPKKESNISLLKRIFSGTPIKETVGFFHENGRIDVDIVESDFNKFLQRIFEDVSKPVSEGGVNSRKLNTAGQILEYLERLLLELGIRKDSSGGNIEDLDDPESDGDKPVTPPNPKPSSGGRPPKNPWDRKRVIKENIININSVKNPKAARVYVELRSKIDVRECPIAAALVLRLFIELSVTRYYESYHDNFSQKWDYKTELYRKVRECAYDMLQRELITSKYANAIYNLGQQDKLISIKTLNEYAHNIDISSNYQIVNTFWDNIQRFIITCWE